MVNQKNKISISFLCCNILYDQDEQELTIYLFSYGYMTMAVDLRELCEDDIPGSSLAGRNPALLKTEELRFWLKCKIQMQDFPAELVKSSNSTYYGGIIN